MIKKQRWMLVALLSVLCILILAGCGESNSSDATESSKEIFAMDTYMTFTAYGANSDEATDQATVRIQELDYMFTSENYAEEEDEEICELYRLNQKGGGELSDEMNQVLGRAMQLNQLTDGAFNPCMYVVMEAWGFTSQNYRVPEKEELNKLLELTDVSNIQYDADAKTLVIKKNGTKIDLGGIVKGYTSSEIIRIFKENGIKSGLVNLGGNVQALGEKTDGTPWRVGIQDPEDSSANIGVVSIKDKAVITSGGYERYFEENGETYHHIIDPKTGFPVDNGTTSVTIVSEDGTLADALSTALFVMGCDKAKAFWKEYGEKYGFEVILVDENHKMLVSEGLSDHFEPSEEYTVEIITK